MRKQVLGDKHPDTATTLFDLAWLYKDRGQYEQAEPLFKEALEIREHVLGPLHPDTLSTLHGLALQNQDRSAESPPGIQSISRSA